MKWKLVVLVAVISGAVGSLVTVAVLTRVTGTYCGVAYRTGEYEWAHLRPAKRFEYFFTEDVAGVVLVLGFMAVLAGFGRSVSGVTGCVAIAATYVAIAWLRKIRRIKLSLARCPEVGAAIGPNSILPWKRTYKAPGNS